MLSMDFEEELDKILLAMPATSDGRHTFLFSATMTSKVAKLQRASLSRPIKVDAKPPPGEDGGADGGAEGGGSVVKYNMPKGLTQQYCFLPAKHKDCYLVHTLNEARAERESGRDERESERERAARRARARRANGRRARAPRDERERRGRVEGRARAPRDVGATERATERERESDTPLYRAS